VSTDVSDGPDESNNLDVFRGDGKRPMPILVFIPDGGFALSSLQRSAGAIRNARACSGSRIIAAAKTSAASLPMTKSPASRSSISSAI
jgi:hypothetical protein